ncbi:hypothetical protein [uncultured Algibacter sp.]|uniref:hypothetical protein n=1 Tax=uncultured Algibacter sp. TaxID=298659 RepID=UPI00263A13DB|nr:hypothetical protein [uncultured Algibacter sp.]
MEKVNYIIQLNAVFECFNKDERIKQGHITLYLAFFQKWNREYFKKTITINRESTMKKAKFKSKTTYHNYIRDLNDWGYLKYFPSYHPARGSKVKMAIFFNSVGQKLANTVPKPGQNLVSSYKHKTKENFNKLARPKNELEVLGFFKENNWPKIEGRKFYAYYETKNWKLSRGLNIKNWKESAKNFVEKGFKIKEEYTNPFSGYVDNLKNNNVKDYDIPL